MLYAFFRVYISYFQSICSLILNRLREQFLMKCILQLSNGMFTLIFHIIRFELYPNISNLIHQIHHFQDIFYETFQSIPNFLNQQRQTLYANLKTIYLILVMPKKLYPQALIQGVLAWKVLYEICLDCLEKQFFFNVHSYHYKYYFTSL
ncbi:hypothetical protein TTHERM_00522879 (macronuclear) [Tetrahymena thermophila SB210]|uniref:Uncharacterized protein n=1 Tax=Tetrahymena thermophila (strain SB210) TaxID=312017 RepID=X1W3S4_TETTS|nr:hypothetical protein TTHERM_00522879 [Tetrahymena thermophila SB210]EDK31781.1 hypothetical protein TTHERM_00522879 [Tetrahymena thermophila SB210]|eukprot:XP_001470768.1 hypothetical protein TTHERM_00522879 [Tetrahymena thermophila SB210]